MPILGTDFFLRQCHPAMRGWEFDPREMVNRPIRNGHKTHTETLLRSPHLEPSRRRGERDGSLPDEAGSVPPSEGRNATEEKGGPRGREVRAEHGSHRRGWPLADPQLESER